MFDIDSISNGSTIPKIVLDEDSEHLLQSFKTLHVEQFGVNSDGSEDVDSVDSSAAWREILDIIPV